MSLYSLLIIALALSLDAFGIAICIGLNDGVKLKNKLEFILSFGFFQFLFSILGAYAGILFNIYVTSVPNIIGGTIISLVGLLMIKEGFENKGKCPLINPKMCIILGISVSIDALVIGFTVLNKVPNNLQLFQYTLIIGLVTLIMSTFAFFIAKYLKTIEFVGKYADYIGGIILIIFGIKMMFF